VPLQVGRGGHDYAPRFACLAHDETRIFEPANTQREVYPFVDEIDHSVDAELGAFIAAQTSVFLATANAAGQPYIQHRGGPAGFLRVLDERTIAFADYRGNRQFITSGNLGENSRAFLFLIDYAQRRRIKIWGAARAVEDDAEFIAALMPAGYKARPDQAIVFTVEAWDENCPQHIPQRFEAADVARALAERDAAVAQRDARIAVLEAELRRRASRDVGLIVPLDQSDVTFPGSAAAATEE
jgi:predicted pyridoxine 5'-phosphate oxidase superfamily flavin-nucleotide-binding protein